MWGGSRKGPKRRHCWFRVDPPAPFDEDGGAVGLRIVAAMSGDCVGSARVARGMRRSDPIPIRGVRAVPTGAATEEEADGDDDEVELSESYTCVTVRVAGGAVRKRVYPDADGGGGSSKFQVNSGVFFDSPAAAVGFISGEFLSCCHLCRKKLHGLDIFMYRGDRAFCSVECRYQQILNDECFRPEAAKPPESPLSAYFAPLRCDAAAVVAA